MKAEESTDRCGWLVAFLSPFMAVVASVPSNGTNSFCSCIDISFKPTVVYSACLFSTIMETKQI